MTNNLILILCAGRASKWKGPVPKQCALVEGKPLIARTIEQVAETWSCQDMYIITHDVRIVGGVSHGAFVSIPTYHRYVCGTLLSTTHLWPGHDRVTVLLGDVVYSPELLSAIDKDTLPEGIRFYGSTHERWAITWKCMDNAMMVETLITSVHVAAVGNALDKLATPFRLLANHPLRQPYGSGKSPLVPELYTLWDHDYVNDFDTVEEYDKWLKQNPWAQ